MKKLRLILLPFGYLYGIIVEAIKLMYRLGWRKSHRFGIPIAVIGNLSTGGTGKTPHVEYILNSLGQQHSIAILSRGYGRTTRGFRWVETTDNALEVGDEPLQIQQKFPEIAVVVAEKRAQAIPKILAKRPQTALVLLDDGMQHWPIIANSYLMLTTYSNPFFEDWLLPAGNLREFRFNYKRADIIVVTKCPEEINEIQRQYFLRKIKPTPPQKVYFSFLKYGQPYHILQRRTLLKQEKLAIANVLLVVGIANPEPLAKRLMAQSHAVQLYKVADHHNYSINDWENILQKYREIEARQGVCIIISTEKDALRLIPYINDPTIPLYIVPIEVEFAFGEGAAFQQSLEGILHT